jgi:hypothetical protein
MAAFAKSWRRELKPSVHIHVAPTGEALALKILPTATPVHRDLRGPD